MKNKITLIFFGLIFLRLLLLNFNSAEIGDSYNLLSAGEALKQWQYPLMEKRLPLLPLLLSFNRFIDQVLFGRLLMLALSLGTLFMSFKIYESISTKKTYGWALILLLATQPIWAYWSMRIMTDVLFGFILVSILYLSLNKGLERSKLIFVMGLLCGLASQTRFEGFILMFAYGLYYFWRRNWQNIFTFLIPALVVIFPFFLRNWMIFGNPFHSSYANEAQGYLPNLRLIAIFLSYLFFLMGPLSVWFVRTGFASVSKRNWRSLMPFALFLIFFVPLIGIWTAAVPRLFYILVPMMTILLVLGIEEFERLRKVELLTIGGILGVFILLVGALRLDFLTGSFVSMAFLSLLSLLGLVFLLRGTRYKPIFILILVLSNLVVAFSVISQAKYRSLTTFEAVQYSLNLNGKIGYADETGVSSWYLRDKGLYWNGDTGYTEALNWMRENKINFLVVTNEHFEEGAQFHVVYDEQDRAKFRLLKRFEREDDYDPFNRIVEKMGIREPKDLPVKYTEVYEIVSYRPAGD